MNKYKLLIITLLGIGMLVGCQPKEEEYGTAEEEIEEVEEVEEETEIEAEVLDEDGYLEGVLEVDGDYIIKGRFKGTIIASGTILIEETGIVECDSIVAENVVVKGHITGDVKAIYQIEVTPTGIVNGEVFCKSLIVDGESIFDGQSRMGGYKIRKRAR
jgi:cytoskeletal protein CcmA (bactofilin family)